MAKSALKLAYITAGGEHRDVMRDLDACRRRYVGVGEESDRAIAKRSLNRLHRTSKAIAALCMGYMHETGFGVTQDMRTGRTLYRQALDIFKEDAERGDVVAVNNYGAMLANGQAGYTDEITGLEWIDRAADLGLPSARYNAGMARVSGFGLEQPELSAGLALLETASKAGDASASDYIAQMLEIGSNGLPKNPDRAVQYHARAALQAQDSYTERAREFLLRLEPRTSGSGAQKDWASLQNSLGPVGARCRIALHWCRSDSLKTYNRGLTELNQMMEKGEADAIYTLAELYLVGAPHRSPDYDLAERYAWETADRGHGASCHIMGVIFRDGLGHAKEPMKARDWFKKAAKRGHAGGMQRLGEMYALGTGGTKDLSESYFWLLKAQTTAKGLPQGFLAKVEAALPKKKQAMVKHRLAQTEQK